jgi:hypothetical protein
VSATGPDRLRLTTQVLASLVIGASITLLLCILRTAAIFPRTVAALLRPGPYLIGKVGVHNMLLAVVADGAFYGLIPFIAMRLRRPRPPELGFQIQANRRRAQRVAVATPVFVYGWMKGEPFSENTETLNVSAIGGLMPLSVEVIPWQKLILVNSQSNEELPCRVVRSVHAANGSKSIGFEFLQASASFWQVEIVPSSSDSAIQAHQ